MMWKSGVVMFLVIGVLHYVNTLEKYSNNVHLES